MESCGLTGLTGLRIGATFRQGGVKAKEPAGHGCVCDARDD